LHLLQHDELGRCCKYSIKSVWHFAFLAALVCLQVFEGRAAQDLNPEALGGNYRKAMRRV
jgi:hypothetical protein